MRAIDRANQEINSGRLWRAKEILQGAIASSPYDPDIFYAYGRLLARMGDLKVAGLYLLLSGKHDQSDASSIALFRQSHSGKSPNVIYSTFPARARLTSIKSFPESVQQELISMGFPENFSRELRVDETLAKKTKFMILFGFGLLAFVVLGLFVVGLIHGAITVYSWIFGAH